MDKIFYFLNILAEKLGRLLFLSSAIACVYFSMKSFGAKSPASGILYFLFGFLPLALLTGALFIRIYLPGIAEKISYGFFGGKRFLAKAPPVLSPIWGDLNSGNYPLVVEKTRILLPGDPRNGELIFLYASAALHLPEEKDFAFLLMDGFFSSPPPKDPWRTKLLFLYADHAPLLKNPAAAILLLQNELPKTYYTKQEKEAISARLTSLQVNESWTK